VPLNKHGEQKECYTLFCWEMGQLLSSLEASAVVYRAFTLQGQTGAVWHTENVAVP